MLNKLDNFFNKYYKYLAIYVLIFYPLKIVLKDNMWERLILVTTFILTIVNCYLEYKEQTKIKGDK